MPIMVKLTVVIVVVMIMNAISIYKNVKNNNFYYFCSLQRIFWLSRQENNA